MRSRNTQTRFRPAGWAGVCAAMLTCASAQAQTVIYGPVYNPDTKHMYSVLSLSDYASAERKAVELGGYLVKVDNEDENRWVNYTFAAYGQVSTQLRWVGVSDRTREGLWEAADGSPLPYNGFAGGEPNNNGGEHCAVMFAWPDGRWNDVACSRQGYGIVEVEDCNTDGVPDSTSQYGVAADYYQYPGLGYLHGSRRELAISFDWSRIGGIGYGINHAQPFDAAFSGYLRVRKTEHYTFLLDVGGNTSFILADPVSGSFVINEYSSSDMRTTVELRTGVRYQLMIMSFGNTGPLRLEWASPSINQQVVPQWAFVATDSDCNDNFAADECDVLEASADCDGNGVPDTCELSGRDCNGNEVLDTCDISGKTSGDCNRNQVPDECELADHDCNHNGTVDACDVVTDPGLDCDRNGAIDACELAAHDCNNNGTLDACEITLGTSKDCNHNGIPDACDLAGGMATCPVTAEHACLLDDPVASADCNANGVADACDIQAGTVQDLNQNLVPDVCEPDCNGNHVPDEMDLATGVLHDCDGNAKMDECEIPVAEDGYCTAAACPGTDCDLNGVLDVCDINRGTHQDCDHNSMPDFCDIRDGRADDCNRNAVPDECELAGQDCNANGIPDACDVGSGELEDCNEDGLPDICETTLVMDEVSGAASSSMFRLNREQTTYQNMIAAYGRPWQPGFAQKPGLLRSDDPASKLRALLTLRTCDAALSNIRPVLPELFAFEMALGNEAFADALDPTIGLNGISPAELGERYAFENVPGISSLLDEELALLRGRALPGGPADWLDDNLYYPAYTDNTNVTRAAVYNRLPPNAGAGSASLAYVSNYGPGVHNNYDAAVRYPQGHGDAFGYYLTATKVYLSAFRGNPDALSDPASQLAAELIAAQPTDTESVSSPAVGVVSLPYQSVRQMVTAMAARARTTLRIVARTYRRDYREDSEDPAAEQVLRDTDGERAWGMGDWARRGVMGAYFDWAVANQLLPAAESTGDTDAPLTQIDRRGVSEIGELSAAIAELQEQVDRAGAGLSPLGLIPNVVPFGINAAELGPGTGRSHYEQVRDAAAKALNNAREVLGYANQGTQRLREQGEGQAGFAAQVEDSEADYTNRLIEIFGYPSRSDVADNDFDSTTTDAQEAASVPDLVNFMLSDDDLKARGWLARSAPGEVELASAEADLAVRRIEEAAGALSNLVKEISELQAFREFLAAKGQDLTTIVDKYGQKQADLKATLIDAEQDSLDAQFYAAWAIKTAASFVKGGLEGAAGFMEAEKICWGGAIAGAVAGGAISGMDMWLADIARKEQGHGFDYARAQEKLNAWKDVQLKQADIDIRNQEQFLKLQSLIRQLPQYRANVSTARQNHYAAVGRLNAAIQRGNRVIAERDRIRKLRRDQLQEYRWKDLAYRTFRNNALQKYDAFFDLAARYVMLAGRAYAYEYNSREQACLLLDRINRERLLGNPVGSSGGLQGILTDLDNLTQVNKFNTPMSSVGQRSFSLRTNLLGLAADAEGGRRFRSFLENNIVQSLQELPAMQDFAQMSISAHYGPAIVVPFYTEVAGNNFFGQGPDAPFGGSNFPVSLNTKIRNVAVRLVGVDTASLGIDAENAYVSVFLLPLGQSVLRENTNAATVEENEPRPWAVVDQWLPAPPLVSALNPAVQDRRYSPWVSTAGSGGNYLNAIKRFRETEAQIELGQAIEFKSVLAGRSVWNTQWLLVIPGKQWTGTTDPAVIRNRLMTLIYGAGADPASNAGMTDIRIIIQAYAN